MNQISKFSSDGELIVLCQNGISDAFGPIFERYSQSVRKSLSKFIKEPMLAEDMVQDTFIKALEAIQAKKYTENCMVKPWLLRIAHNLVIDYHRGVKSRGRLLPLFENFKNPSASFSDKEKNMEEYLVSLEWRDKIKKLIDQLPSEQKHVVVLRHYAGCSFKEISALTQTSINTSIGRMRYALINMRNVLAIENTQDNIKQR